MGTLLLLLGLALQPPAGREALQVVVEDADLGRAIVRSAAQQFPGAVVLVPAGAARPAAGVLRLRVRWQAPGRLALALRRTGGGRVERTLVVGARADRFDVAESVALALADLQARLGVPAARPEAHRPRAPADKAAPAPAAPPPSLAPAPAAPPPLLAPAPAAPPRPPQGFGAPGAEAPAPRRWKLALGIPLAALGLAAVAVGAISLAVDGGCADETCDRRYAGRSAGAVELALGTAAVLGGAGLIALELRQGLRRGPRRLGVAPIAGGLSLAGTF